MSDSKNFIPVKNLGKCRFCGANQENLVMFTTKLQNLFVALMNVPLQDGGESKICEICHGVIFQFASFKIMCLRAEQRQMKRNEPVATAAEGSLETKMKHQLLQFQSAEKFAKRKFSDSETETANEFEGDEPDKKKMKEIKETAMKFEDEKIFDKKSVSKASKAKLIKYAAMVGLDHFHEEVFDFEKLHAIATVLMQHFPLTFPHEEELVTSTGSGSLYLAAWKEFAALKDAQSPAVHVIEKQPNAMKRSTSDQTLSVVKRPKPVDVPVKSALPVPVKLLKPKVTCEPLAPIVNRSKPGDAKLKSILKKVLPTKLAKPVKFSWKIKGMILKRSGDIWKTYEAKKSLTSVQTRQVLIHAARIAIKLFANEIPKFKNIQKVAQALMNLFPNIFTQEKRLVNLNKDGELDLAICDCLQQPENKENETSNLKVVLSESLATRRSLLNRPDSIDFMFPIIKEKPFDVINFEFEALYRGKGDCLLTEWPKIANSIELLQKPLASNIKKCPRVIQQFLLLIQVCDCSTSDIIQFYRCGQPINTSATPLIALMYEQGGNTMKIVEVSIVAGANVLKLPKDSKFVQIVDIVYKVHHVFNINYGKSVETFYKYIEEFIFGTRKFGIAKNDETNERIQNLKKVMIKLGD